MRPRDTHAHVAPRGQAVILFSVGNTPFAIPASAVDEIRSIAGLRRVAAVKSARVPKVKFELVRAGRTYFVVDATQHFHMLPTPLDRVLVLRDAVSPSCAVLVTAIDRMMEISGVTALPRAFQGKERHWYRGVTIVGDNVVPVVDPAAFLAANELAELLRPEAAAETTVKVQLA